MAHLYQIRDAFHQRLTMAGLRATSKKGNEPPPIAVVRFPFVDYAKTMGDAGYFGDLEVTVDVLVGNQINSEAVKVLTEYAEPVGHHSIFAAFKRESATGRQTLGDLADDCYLKGFRELGLDEAEGYSLWGGQFRFLVLVKKESS